jgi:glycosyltransferase involved in cell wall biosynthesis
MISVILCTYNRAERLKLTLASLAKMSIPAELSWELIIVDNNSSDETKNVVFEFAIGSAWPVQYVFEAHQGLSRARNRGMQQAGGDILAFTDDDCVVAPTWITSIQNEFISDIDLNGLGGRVLLYDELDHNTRSRRYEERTTFTSLRQLFKLIPGCNMAFRRQVFKEVQEFDPALGAGTQFHSAEDSDFLYRAFLKSFKMIHAPDVIVYHNHGRRTAEQTRALHRGYLIGRGAFYSKHILAGDKKIFQLASFEIYRRTKRLVKCLLIGKSARKHRRRLYFLLLGMANKMMDGRHQTG